MKKNLILIICFFILVISSYAESVRLKDISRVYGARSNQLMGMGLVVGLNGDGDKSALTPQMLQNLFKYFGADMAQSQIKSKNVAAVMVTAELPPFKKSGDKIDITISSVNDAKTLTGGVLLQTPLIAADGQIYAVGQGVLTKVADKNGNKVNGFIANGAIIEKEVEVKLDPNDKLKIVLNNPDFTTAARVADAINNRYNYDTARALDGSTIEIKKAFVYNDELINFISTIENIEVTPDRKSVIVINERTGTVVMGEDIKVSPVAISQGNLSISLKAQEDFRKAFDGEQTQGNNKKEVKGKTFFFNGTNVKDVVKMLNAVGAASDDIISILEALKAAGAIDAEIKIM